MSKIGRPTKYAEEFCQKLIDHMSEGFTYEAFAGKVAVNLDTLYQWEKDYPSFSEAKKIGRAAQQSANEKLIQDIAKGKIRNGNATAAIFILKNCHPKTWRDRHEIDHRDLGKKTLEELKEEARRLLEEVDEPKD